MTFNYLAAFNSIDAVLAEHVSSDIKYAYCHYHIIVKREVGFLRTFYMCGRKWGEGKRFESTLLSIEDAVIKIMEELYSVNVRITDDDQLTEVALLQALQELASKTQEIIEPFDQEIKELYIILLDGSLAASPKGYELPEIIDSLVKNFGDILRNGTFDLFVPLQEGLVFFKNLIRFAEFRGLEHWQMEDLLTQKQVSIIDASRLTYKFSPLTVDEEMWGKTSELVRKFKPVKSHVCDIYIQVLLASKLTPSSQIPTLENDGNVLGDFVDSLLGYLWGLLKSFSKYWVSKKDPAKKLYHGLRFLRNILREPKDKFSKIYEGKIDLIEVLISEAGIVVCSLLKKDREGGLPKEMDLGLSEVLDKIKLIKAEAAERYPIASEINFPQTNMMGFIDALLGKMNSLSLYEADSTALPKFKFLTIQEDLMFLRSFLGDVMVGGNQYKEIQSLWHRVTKVAYETEFILDSLMVGDTFENFVMLFDSITEELKLIKTEAVESVHVKSHVIKVQELAKSSGKMASVGRIPDINEVVGFDNDAQIIIDRLTRATKQLDFVFIVGIPGLGKTTLARKVYDDASIVYYFHIRAWCSVSQVYNKKSLLLEILSCIVTKLDDRHFEMNEDDLALELYRHLKQRKYLIILDDVWDSGAWKVLANSFPNDANGSRILFTSRLHSVASEVKPDSEPHVLHLLDNDESWELLRR